MHHYERSRWRRQVHDDVSLLLVEAGAIGATPYERAIVTVEFRWRDEGRRSVTDTYSVEVYARGTVDLGEPVATVQDLEKAQWRPEEEIEWPQEIVWGVTADRWDDEVTAWAVASR